MRTSDFNLFSCHMWPSQLLVRLYLYDHDSCCFPKSGAKVLSVSVAGPLVSNRGRNTLSA